MEKLKKWGEILGNIRDLDVLQAAWQEFSDRYSQEFETTGVAWHGIIAERRDFLAATVLHRMEQGELTRNLFELQAWLLNEAVAATAKGYVAATENNIRKALLAMVQNLRDETGSLEGIPEVRRLHALRIRLKRLRYLMEAVSVVPRYRDDTFLSAMKKMQNVLGKIHDVYQIKSLLQNFEAGEGDSKQSFQQELFIGWHSRDALRNFFALPAAFEGFRKAAKAYSRILAALRDGRRVKAAQDTNPHEPA